MTFHSCFALSCVLLFPLTTPALLSTAKSEMCFTVFNSPYGKAFISQYTQHLPPWTSQKGRFYTQKRIHKCASACRATRGVSRCVCSTTCHNAAAARQRSVLAAAAVASCYRGASLNGQRKTGHCCTRFPQYFNAYAHSMNGGEMHAPNCMRASWGTFTSRMLH